MIVSGALPITDTQLQGNQNRALVDTGVAPAGNFSALLFLVLGNTQLPTSSTADATGANNILLSSSIMNAEPMDGDREDIEPQWQTIPAPIDTGSIRLAHDVAARMTDEWDIQCENEALPPAVEIFESHDTSGESSAAVETQLFQIVPVQASYLGVETAVWPAAAVSGVENESAGIGASLPMVAGSERLVPQMSTVKPPAIQENIDMGGTFQKSGGANAETATVVPPTEAASPPGTLTAETPAVNYRTESSDRYQGESLKFQTNEAIKTAQHETSEDVKQTQVQPSEFVSGEAYARNQWMAPSGRQRMAASASSSEREHAVLNDSGSMVVQPESDTAQDASLSIASARSGKEASASSHHSEQDSSFQQHFQHSSKHQAALHITAHDTASAYSIHALDVIQEAPARAHDWRLLIDHVAGEIRGHIRIGKSEAVIRLDPPELGNLKIDLRMEGDKVEARIYAENHESATLIEAHLPELRQALAESRVEHVELRVDNANWSGARGDGQQGRRREPGDGQPQTHDSGGARRDDSNRREPARPQAAWTAGRVSMWA